MAISTIDVEQVFSDFVEDGLREIAVPISGGQIVAGCDNKLPTRESDAM